MYMYSIKKNHYHMFISTKTIKDDVTKALRTNNVFLQKYLMVKVKNLMKSLWINHNISI